MGAAVLLTAGCGVLESGSVGVFVQDGKIHALAQSCPSWRTTITLSSPRFDSAQWFIDEPGDHSSPDAAVSRRSGDVVLPAGAITNDGFAVDVVVGQVRDGAVVIDGDAGSPATGDTLVTLNAGGTTRFFARPVTAKAQSIVDLSPASVLIGVDDATYKSGRTVPKADFATVACTD